MENRMLAYYSTCTLYSGAEAALAYELTAYVNTTRNLLC